MRSLALFALAIPGIAAAAPANVVLPAASEDVRLGSCGIELQWTSPGAGYDGVVVLRASGAAPNQSPTDGTVYSVGATLGNATVAYADYNTSSGTVPQRIRDASAPAGTLFYKFFAHDSALRFADGVVPDASGLKVVRRCTGPSDTSWLYEIGGSLMALPSVSIGTGGFFGSSLGSISAVLENPAAEQFRPSSIGGVVDQRPPLVPLGDNSFIFATAEDGFAYALNASTGAQLWSYDARRPGQASDSLTGSPSVQIRAYSNSEFQSLSADDLVFLGTRYTTRTDNRVIALNAATGTPVWTYNPGNLDVVLAQPTVDYTNNRVYVSSDSNGGTQPSVHAFSTMNAFIYWEQSLGDVETAPALTADGQLLVGTVAGELVSLSPISGSINWSLNLGLGSLTWGASIVPLNRSRALFSASGRVFLVTYTATSATLTWVQTIAGASSPTATPGGALAWVGGSDGKLHEVKLADGTDSATLQLAPSGVALGQPAVDTTLMRAYVGAASGTLYSIRLPLSSIGSGAGGAEICNGLDDNNDGQIDEGFTCALGAQTSCSTSCGSQGVATCTSSCAAGTCVAPVEECNGVDDNCNGGIDEGFQCQAGSVRACTTSCNTAGSQTCNPATCSYGPCEPPGGDTSCPPKVVLATLACGGAWGANVQTSAAFTNMGTFGEPTPPNVGNAAKQTSSQFINFGGFEAASH